MPSEQQVEAAIQRPVSLPRPHTLEIDCPQCGAVITYTPEEDDAGSFYAEQDWPICEPCNVLVDVPPIRISKAHSVYHADRYPAAPQPAKEG